MKKKLCLSVLLLAYILLEVSFLKVTPISGTSMLPTFDDGDMIVQTTAPWWLALSGKGDVITLGVPGPEYLIKRIVAEDDQLILLDRVDPVTQQKEQVLFYVPKDSYFVEGDNRDNSLDSRYFGPLPNCTKYGLVLGKWHGINVYPF